MAMCSQMQKHKIMGIKKTITKATSKKNNKDNKMNTNRDK